MRTVAGQLVRKPEESDYRCYKSGLVLSKESPESCINVSICFGFSEYDTVRLTGRFWVQGGTETMDACGGG